MDNRTMDILEDVSRAILFGRPYNHCDVLEILNWVQDHRPVSVYQNNNGFLCLCYCGRCSTIVAKGDKYCNQCGRALKWE